MSTVTSAASPSDTVVGLLGNGNGDQSDDLTAKNGTVLSLNSTEEEIYYHFGQTCESVEFVIIKQTNMKFKNFTCVTLMDK